MLKRIINTIIWTVVALYVVAVVMFHVPFVQREIGSEVAGVLSGKLGTSVSVGRVDLGFANRLIIDDVNIRDQQDKQMLRAARMSVKIDLLPLLRGRIVVSSSQFFALKLNLYKPDAQRPANFQFVIDSLKSKEPSQEPTPIDLQVGAIVIRHGQVTYRQLDKPSVRGRFSPTDLDLQNISAHLILDKLTNDSLNLRVKKLAFDEKSGLRLRGLSFHFVANRKQASLNDFRLQLPATDFRMDKCSASYEFKDGQLSLPSLKFTGGIANTVVGLSDFACFVPRLKTLNQSLHLTSKFHGSEGRIVVETWQMDASRNGLQLLCNATISNVFDSGRRTWNLQLQRLSIQNQFASEMAEALGTTLPSVVEHLGDIVLQGHADGTPATIHADGLLKTTIGDAHLAFDKAENQPYKGRFQTDGLDLQRLTGDKRLGNASAEVTVQGRSLDEFHALATVNRLQFNAYDYRNITLDATRRGDNYDGELALQDPHADLWLSASLTHTRQMPSLSLQATVHDFSPSRLNLSNKWGSSKFSLDVVADLQGHDLHDVVGALEIKDFLKTVEGNVPYEISRLRLATEREEGGRRLTLDGDFGHVGITGNFDYATLPNSIYALVGKVLPTLPGLPKARKAGNNDFTLTASLSDTRWLDELLNVPLLVRKPMTLDARLDDPSHEMSLVLDAPDFTYSGKPYLGTSLRVSTPDDTIKAVAHTDKLMDNGKRFSWNADVSAHHDRLTTTVRFDNHEVHPFRGSVNADTWLRKDDDGLQTAFVDIQESDVTVGDATWHVRPSTIVYKKNNLMVDGFAFEHDNQFIAIDGCASNRSGDSLLVNLQNVDVSYILNLVNFHSVDFSGLASGTACVAGVFTERPRAVADLSIADFRFENGRMGTLAVLADYDNEEGQINIDAVARDEGSRHTTVKGYVSPKHSYIDLAIGANRTRLEFMQSFCSSFLQDIDASGDGAVRLFGPLSNINLTGQLVANGTVGISSLNTRYEFRNDTVRFIPDEIQFLRDTIYDRNGNIGILSGSLFHKHLTNLSYDLNVEARNLLSYDTHTYGENTFFGTVFATGNCRIEGRSGEVNFDINATPNKGSIITYKVDSRSDLSSADLLTWVAREPKDSLAQPDSIGDLDHSASPEADKQDTPTPYATDIRMNFLVNCTPDATIKLIMDESSGDYIDLNGDGVLRATYYNKGSFDLYGNYIVDHGIYKLTIQNVIKKDFTFEQGGVLAFGGDPFEANINLKAHYALNGVSLSDLNIGRSFNNNNIRVDCLMNITGTAGSPKVDFSLDMPTLGNDVKQMVRSIINAEEEMNQQVLYLLAVGRFYNRGANNAGEGTLQDSQTSLAMQSFLSGTISQQINQVLGTVVNSSNWNFGANISTGSEGFYNAEYEGLLSGRLLNNRLIFNGQFGYRDNANATTSFIGDFDLRYLLYPNGNLSINVYNKANDRYFTRNSLNTQGVGITVKRDFNSLRDLLNLRKRKKQEK